LIAYWLLVLSLVALLAAFLRRGNFLEALSPIWFYAVAVMLPQLLRGIRTSLARPIVVTSVLEPAKPDRRSDNLLMDERERTLDAKMHSRAYYYLYLFVLPLVFFMTVIENRSYVELAFLRIPLLWLLWLLVSSLPQSLILWNEPDLEEPQ